MLASNRKIFEAPCLEDVDMARFVEREKKPSDQSGTTAM